jgi:CheY-like chemotaxis protein
VSTRILVVEDNVDTSAMLRLLLEKTGYTVSVAYNGEEGLAAAKNVRPDLILLDLMMPVLDGFGTHRALKDDPSLAQIPVIILTAKAGMASLFESMGQQGVKAYLTKPISPELLRSTIKRVLEGESL